MTKKPFTKTAAPTNEHDNVLDAEKRTERKPRIQDYIRVFSYGTKWDLVVYVVASLASVGAGVTLPLMNVIIGRLAGRFAEFFMEPPRITRSEFQAILNIQSLYMLGLFLGRFVLNSINKFGFRMTGIRLSSAIRLHYMKSLFGQSVHVLDSMPSGAAASTITNTANILQIGISEKLGIFLEFNGTVWCAIIVAYTWNWKLTLVTSSLIGFILLVVTVLLPLIAGLQNQQVIAEAKANAVASESLSSIRMVTACGAQQRMTARYSRWVDQGRAKGQRMAPLLALQLGLLFFGSFAVFALAFWFGTRQLANREITNSGTILIVIMSVMMIVMSMERISNPLVAMSKAMVAACEFFAVIDAPKPQDGHLREPDVSAADDIIFEDVTFAYPSRPHVKILDCLNLRIEAGKNTAIVGPSGSGKSTIVGLIERWYGLREQYVIERTPKVKKDKETEQKQNDKSSSLVKPVEKRKNDRHEGVLGSADNEGRDANVVALSGNITTGGKALSDINLSWWRSQIGLVQQEPFLFNDSIFQNVAHGLIGSEKENASEEEKRQLVKEACEEAFATEFINRLPDGLETTVGDGGAKLSGGQRQRIAIARSIVKKPKIMILDEATSAIDVRSEKIVQAALDRIAKNRTTITIAHRLSTIKKADRIVVLRKGKVVESGTHDSLLQIESGAYHSLVVAQNLSLGQQSEDYGVSGEDESDQTVAVEKYREVSAPESGEEIQPSQAEAPRGLKNFITLLTEQKNRRIYLVIAFFAACSAAGTPLMAWLFAQSFQVFTSTDKDTLRSEGRFWALMWLTLAAGVSLGYFFQSAIAVNLQHNISALYKKEYFKSILLQDTTFFDDDANSHGTLVARIASDPKQLEELLGLNMALLIMSAFGFIGALAISYAFGWKLATVSVFVAMPVTLLAGYWKYKYELEFEKMNTAVFAESSKFAAEAIGAFRTVSSLTMEDAISTRYEKLLQDHVNKAYKKSRWTSILFGLTDSVNIGCQGLIFWYGGRLLANREYTIIDFFVCFMAAIQGAEAAGSSLGYGPNAAQASAAASRIIGMRHSNSQADGHEMLEQIPDTEGGVKIELRDLYFRYPTRDVPVFTGLNLTIKKGQFAALVGPSGCGKSSIVSLLERFYTPGRGEVLCNGRNISGLDVNQYRSHVSLVAQEPYMFQGTIRENVCLGVEEDSVSDERLHEVCREAAIHDFIVSLPDGYNTDIGSKGFSLSGGQKQRLAIARALIRDPKIILLDEATSSLDSESEKLVQAAFERAGRGRTMLCIAHRLATVQNADVIFVLGNGNVVESGTHQELLRLQGVYWQMCQSQALDR